MLIWTPTDLRPIRLVRTGVVVQTSDRPIGIGFYRIQFYCIIETERRYTQARGRQIGSV